MVNNQIMKIILPHLLLTAASLLALSGCESGRDDAPAQQESQALESIQQELSALRTELARMNLALTEVHRAVAVPPEAPAPAPVRLQDVDIGDDPRIGAADASLALVEFADYQCPYCARHQQQTMPMLREQYIDTGKLQYIFKDYALDFHPQAKAAAVAANCAGAQGQYWPMHDALFAEYRNLGEELYQRLAGELKLDLDAFTACQQDAAQLKEIDADRIYGEGLGVQGTPQFYLGRVEGGRLVDALPINGAQPYSVFATAIGKLLKK